MSNERRRPLAGVDPVWPTVAITLVAYAIVLGTFYDVIPIYPELGRGTIDALSHATAVVNAITVVSILAGLYWIKQRQIRKHAGAMVVATLTILAFLILYLTRIGGGGQKALAGDPNVLLSGAYIVMLAIHILLSMIAVPLVVFVLILALRTPINRLGATRHPQVGRIAATAWLVSLLLGIGAYLILNHIVGAELAV